MAQLYDILKPENKYWDKKNFTSIQGYNAALQITTTVYVGNLSFYTQQNSIKQLFERTGNVKDIIMGIDNDGNPCGFCFVVYESRQQAQLAVEYISKTRLGGRIIRVDWDPGYLEGRQKGRGTSGQQRREDFRNKQDPERPKKKIVTNDQSTSSGYRNDYSRDRGDNYRNNRGDRNDSYRGGQRRDFKPRQYRNDRGDRPEREDRGDRGYRRDRNDRGDRGQRYDRGNRNDRYGEGDRGDRGQRRYDREPAQNREPRENKQVKQNKQQEQDY